MAIILKNSWNVPPARWGSFEDVQYAIRVNSEKIYGIDSSKNSFNMPLFWGNPVLDYGGQHHHGSVTDATFYDGAFHLKNIGSKINIGQTFLSGFTKASFSVYVRPIAYLADSDILVAGPHSAGSQIVLWLDKAATDHCAFLMDPSGVFYSTWVPEFGRRQRNQILFWRR